MSELTHDRSLLGPYVLGVLDADEARAVETHLASCAECRVQLVELEQMRDLLGEVPPEAFLDGPPDGGDLMLQRTLRTVRSDVSRRGMRRLAVVAASVVALAVATLGGGILIGQRTASTTVAQGPPPATSAPVTPPTSSPPSLPAGTRTVTGTDLTTGTRMTATITPAAGWVRVHATVGGVPAGKRCELKVTSRTGASLSAGSWLVSAKGAQEGTTLDGSALVAASDVASIDVVTFEGEKLVSVPL